MLVIVRFLIQILQTYLYKWPVIILLTIVGFLISIAQAAQYHNWVLSGTFLSEHNAHAMFVNTDGNELLVAQGSKIHGCELMDVMRGSVKLRCGEILHTLHLRNSIGEVIPHTPQPGIVAQAKTITLPREGVMNYVKQRQRLVSEIGFLPLIENQQVIGFTLSKIRPNTSAAALGLYNGDIIKSVNGVSASQPGQFLQTVKELSQLSAVSIEVDRYGQSLAYTYILE